jgi:hypothetical protein
MLDNVVSSTMAEGVIDPFEEVDVDHQDAYSAPIFTLNPHPTSPLRGEGARVPWHRPATFRI